jgi:hypothetical protein
MAFRPPPQQPDFSSLYTSLAQTKAKKSDEAMYQTINFLIERIDQFQEIVVKKLDVLEEVDEATDNIGYPIELGHSSL